MLLASEAERHRPEGGTLCSALISSLIAPVFRIAPRLTFVRSSHQSSSSRSISMIMPPMMIPTMAPTAFAPHSTPRCGEGQFLLGGSGWATRPVPFNTTTWGVRGGGAPWSSTAQQVKR